jgi:hypothetical protein
MAATCLGGAFGLSGPQDENSNARLARLSYLEGHVSFQHASDVDWSAASINLPIEPGDRFYTGHDGRAEIQFDDGSAFRLAGNTDVEILSLKQELIQIRLLVGLCTLNANDDTEFEINTPAAAFNAIRAGIYRFDVIENGDTDAIVRKGELEAANNNFSQRMKAGDLMHLSPRDNGKPEMSLYDRRDAWDEWNDRRNADLQVNGNQQYLPDNVYIGASDLNRYGRWVNVEVYGTAWVPYGVDPYWAPYSVGRWCYRPFYGWTWVSYEPWGWLPYHYGRWHRNALYGWYWLPGPSFAFNFWSPGLVNFYRGPGWVSWCPLGPGDYYDPRKYHYRHGIHGHQIAELHKLNTRQPGDPINRDVRGSFSTAQLEQFREGSFDGRNRSMRLGNVEQPWNQGTLVRDRLDIQPTSKSFGAAMDRAAVRPSVVSTLPAVVRNVPERDFGKREQFTRITNPQVRSISSGGARGVETETNAGSTPRADGRVIQIPGNSSAEGQADTGGGRVNSSQWSGSRATAGENSGARSRSTAPVRPEKPVPPGQPNSGTQAPSRWRIERAVPEQPTTPQPAQPARPAPQSSPRSEFRHESSSSSAARPGIGRWSDSGAGSATRSSSAGVRTFTVPRSESGGRWMTSNSRVERPSEAGNLPAFAAPRFDGGGRWNYSAPRMEPSPNAGRTSGYSFTQPSGPSSVGRSGGGRPAAPSRSSGNGSGGRAAPGGDFGRRGR